MSPLLSLRDLLEVLFWNLFAFILTAAQHFEVYHIFYEILILGGNLSKGISWNFKCFFAASAIATVNFHTWLKLHLLMIMVLSCIHEALNQTTAFSKLHIVILLVICICNITAELVYAHLLMLLIPHAYKVIQKLIKIRWKMLPAKLIEILPHCHLTIGMVNSAYCLSVHKRHCSRSFLVSIRLLTFFI